MNIILIIYKNHKWLVVHKLELRSFLKLKNCTNFSVLISKSFLLISLTSDQIKSNKSEKLSGLTTVLSSLPRTYFILIIQTLIKKILRLRIDGIHDDEFKHLEQFGGKVPELNILTPILKDKIALIFCDAPVYTLKQKIEANKVPTEARVGAISPIDYAVPAGPTGLDPSQINFFHALNVSTKIVKGQIEITKDFRVCTIGKKVKASEAALLKKLNVKPFEYGMRIIGCYDSGAILPQEVINIDPASLLTAFQSGIKNLAGLSLEAGYPIEATVPLILANSFKNIAALSLESG